jgi:hypothetical protein
MALPASDNFNRDNENPIVTNWTTGTLSADNVLQLLSNAVRSSSTGDTAAYWDADAFNADQWSECKIVGGASPDGGPAVRVTVVSNVVETAYYWTPQSDGEVWSYVHNRASSWAKIGEANCTVTSSDVIKIQATGTGATVTIKVYKNNGLVATLTDTDATYRILSGSAGVYSNSDTTLDDWAGGNFVGSASASASASASTSRSPSRSQSPSSSPSASASSSVSRSASSSVSASASAVIEGTVCWGHETDVLEDNVRTFADNWTGTGTISGEGDAETICLAPGEYRESEVVYTGERTVELELNHYASP